MESRIAIIGLVCGVVSAFLAWCTHAWYFDACAAISIGACVFGYAYMDK